MTDRELLELAAKAAGIGLFVWGAKGAENFTIKLPNNSPGTKWNPLKDDGDALRLAVKLGIDVIQLEKSQSAYANSSQVLFSESKDKYSATRRAIVRAAAEIGKKMK
jgi:hypothetical protein